MSKNEIDVSVIVAAYNTKSAFFRAALDSIVAIIKSSSVNCELLIFDDASPDECPAIAEEYRSRYPDIIRLYGSEINIGAGHARSRLTEHARGRYILPFDSDDILLPFDLAGGVRFLDCHPEYCASYGRKYLFDENGLTGDVHGNEVSRFSAFFTPKLNINAMLIRREDLVSHDSFTPLPGSRISEDVYLMYRLATDRDFYFDRSAPRCLYRVHRNQISKMYENSSRDYPLMGQLLADRYPEIYRRILHRDIPDETPANSRIVQGFTGLAAFLNQHDQDFMQWLCQEAVRRHPEDYGAREHLLLMLGARALHRGFEEAYQQAVADFAGDELVLWAFADQAAKAYQRAGLDVPEDIRRDYAKWHSIANAVPAIVSSNLPPVKRPVYSYKAPALKI